MSDENAIAPTRSKDEVALELMKFVAMSTGYGKGGPSAGFGSKAAKTPEEYAESLLQLFERCRTIVHQTPKGEKK